MRSSLNPPRSSLEATTRTRPEFTKARSRSLTKVRVLMCSLDRLRTLPTMTAGFFPVASRHSSIQIRARESCTISSETMRLSESFQKPETSIVSSASVRVILGLDEQPIKNAINRSEPIIRSPWALRLSVDRIASDPVF